MTRRIEDAGAYVHNMVHALSGKQMERLRGRGPPDISPTKLINSGQTLHQKTIVTDAVAPISRNGFIYDGSFRADVGNHNFHPRASVSQLAAMLRPKRTKSINRRQARDQVGHWYFAQLKHYGLLTTKDKNAAKVRLLNALNTKALEVPKDVKTLEAELKKEFKAAKRGSKPDPPGQKPVSGRKRSNNPEISSSTTTISVNKAKKTAKSEAERG